MFKPGITMDLRDHCDECGLDFSKSDSADGPAFFIMSALSFIVVPLALWMEFAISPPLWAHVALWAPILLGVTVGMLRPLKAYIIALQYRYRPEDWR